MKRVSLIALVSVCAGANAQTPEWFATRFGLNVHAQAPRNNAPMTQISIPKFQEGKANLRYNDQPGIMQGALVVPSTKKYRFDDPLCATWAEMFEATDLLPANTWVRFDGAVNQHFWNPYDADMVQKDRIVDGVIGRLMYRNADPKNALNLLFVVTPGIYAHSGTADSWSSVTVDPFGKKLPTPIKMMAPKDRDWWRPEPAMLPYLKQSFQRYVNIVNDAAATQAVAKYGAASAKNFNFVQKIGFQLGNEPGTGHPGGSQFAKVGSWQGLGRVNEGIMVGINYGVSPAVRTALGIPASFGSNPLSMPAFSFLNENANQFIPNYVSGKLKNFAQSGGFSPGVNELASYSQEMVGYNWSQQCGRRSLHFRSPILRWRFFKNDFSEVAENGKDLLFYGPQDPKWGAWETPEQYAKRWVEELERGVDMVANLPMPAASKVVDITECYFVNGDLGANPFDANMLDANGKNITFADKTLDQVRELAKNYRVQNGKFTPLLPTQMPPTRKQLLAAIRNELYQRDVVQKNLSKNLGRIYIWSSLNRECRDMVGLNTGANNNVVGYNPWNDFKLNLDEIKAIWNIK